MLKRLVRARAVLLLVCAVASAPVAHAQDERTSPTCDQVRAVLLVQQQVNKAKNLNNVMSRLSIMLRAADLLWPLQRDTAHSIFAEAYNIAEADYRRQADEQKGARKAGAFVDARLSVLQAIARHDAVWSRQLSSRLTEDAQRDDGVGDKGGDPQEAGITLLRLAGLLLPAQKELAASLFRSSSRYPASSELPHFLYKLAGTDQALADRLYLESLSWYADAPVGQLLYLSAYPYGLSRLAGPEALSIFLQVPTGFTPSDYLQQRFLAALIQRGNNLVRQSTVQTGLPSDDTEMSHLYLALNGLEQVIGQHQQEFLEHATQLRNTIGAYLSQEERQNATIVWQRQQDELRDPFTKFIEKAEQATSPLRKDAFTAYALMRANDEDQLSRVGKLLGEVSDPELRRQLLNWLYFKQAQLAMGQGRFDRASQFAEKVDSLDHRAYLLCEISAKLLGKKVNDKGLAREMLERVITAASKAPDTNEKARALLGAVYLYSKFDIVRALEVLRDAVKVINAIEEPDLMSLSLSHRIQGRGFNIYATYQIRGFTLENTFAGLASYDFEGALALAERLENQPLSATAVLALTSRCLESPPTALRPHAHR